MVFVDTGAWYALQVADDPDHQAARRWLKSNEETLVTTDYVIAETITLFRMRDKTSRGHKIATEFGMKAFAEELALIEWVQMQDVRQALEIFERYHDKRFSFVDCLSFAVMGREGIHQAFAFDRNFDQYGFARVP